MSQDKKQITPEHSLVLGLGASLKHAALAFMGMRQLLNEFSSAAAHYDGLIDSIERAGWELGRVEQVKHAFDSTAQRLLNELINSYPDMTETEQESFMAPFHTALHRFSLMNAKEKAAFRAEYDRFKALRAQSDQAFAAQAS